jgi:hypothetical protein
MSEQEPNADEDVTDMPVFRESDADEDLTDLPVFREDDNDKNDGVPSESDRSGDANVAREAAVSAGDSLGASTHGATRELSASAEARESVASPSTQTPLLPSATGQASAPAADVRSPSHNHGTRDSSPGAASLSDFTMGGQQEEILEDDGCPLYLRKDFAGVPRRLRNTDLIKFDIPLDIIRDDHGVIRVPDEHVKTMDGVGKCLQLIPADDLSHYVQPCDGYPLTFVARSVCIF